MDGWGNAYSTPGTVLAQRKPSINMNSVPVFGDRPRAEFRSS